METSQDPRKDIIKSRFTFLLEVLLIFLGIFLFMLIPRFILPIFVKENSFLYGPMFYLLRAVAILLAIPIFLVFSNMILESQRKEIILEEDIPPSKGHLMLYEIKKDNYQYQILYGVLILFILFIPLDFLIYFLFPETLEYSAEALGRNSTDKYLFGVYAIFLFSVIIIQISVAIYEESLARGFLAKRGSENFHKISAVLIASMYFGIMHFAIVEGYPIWFPIIWAVQAFCVGVILSIAVVRKKWLFPVIFAHALNNIISAHAIWLYIHGTSFTTITLYMYLPLLCVSAILFIWKFSVIKESVSNGAQDFMTYFQIDTKLGETSGDRAVRIVIDIVIVLLIVVSGLLFAI